MWLTSSQVTAEGFHLAHAEEERLAIILQPPRVIHDDALQARQLIAYV
jgi:hypothetical protein